MANLLEPKEIEITSGVGGEHSQVFRLGTWTALDGQELLVLSKDFAAIMANITPSKDPIKDAKTTRKITCEFLKYIEAKTLDGDWQRLDNEASINGYVTDREMLNKLILASNDHNSFFLNSGNLSKTFRTYKGQVLSAVTRTLTQWSDTLSPKKARRGKS